MDADVGVTEDAAAPAAANEAQGDAPAPVHRSRAEVIWVDPIATWSWASLKHHSCSICRIDLNETAILATSARDDAHEHANHFTDIFKGGCGHTFHRICIERWLAVRPVCPQCIQPWSLCETKSFQQ